jgi:glycogen operon protein
MGPAPHRRPDVTWHGVHLGQPDWGSTSRSLAMHLAGEYAHEPDCDIYLAANAWREDLVFELPPPALGTRWVQVVDTAAPSPHDIATPGDEALLADQHRISVRDHACVVLRSA